MFTLLDITIYFALCIHTQHYLTYKHATFVHECYVHVHSLACCMLFYKFLSKIHKTEEMQPFQFITVIANDTYFNVK